jgi:hypothetical protein
MPARAAGTARTKRVAPAARANTARHPGTGAFAPVSSELDRMVPLNEASVLAGISRDSLRRHYGHLIRQLSPRRVGMRVRDVLSIGSGSNNAAPSAPAA